jgi:hypothetical protein
VKKELAVNMATNAMMVTKTKAEENLYSGRSSLDYLVLSIMGDSKRVRLSIMKGANYEKVGGG